MILTKEELNAFIEADRERYHLRKPRILGAILKDESYFITKFLYVLRHLEYYTNKHKKLLEKNIWIYWYLMHRYLKNKYKILHSPNIVEKGLYIPHIVGGIIINAKTCLGKLYC